VRVIAATNKDLAAEVRAGRFREDLYYRLNVVHIDMPPLRVRGRDVCCSARPLPAPLRQENQEAVEGFTDAGAAKLAPHRWPGNVRELENAIERAVVLCEGRALIDDEHLPFEGAPARQGGGSTRIPGSTMAEIERYAILGRRSTPSQIRLDRTRCRRDACVLDQRATRTIQYRLRPCRSRTRPRSPAEARPSRRSRRADV
jgi:two-component system response regulator HydG